MYIWTGHARDHSLPSATTDDDDEDDDVVRLLSCKGATARSPLAFFIAERSFVALKRFFFPPGVVYF